MTAKKSKLSDEAEIRELIESWVKAVRTKDINGLMSNYAPNVVSFEVMTPIQYVGADAYKKIWEMCFLEFQGPIGYEIRDLSITTSETIAFSHSINRFSGTRKDGKEEDMWLRATVCFQKINGKWMVTHEHASVPFDVESGQAALHLKP